MITKKAGLLDPNERFFVLSGSLPKSVRPNVIDSDLVECKMLSDNDGSTKSKVILTGGIFEPLFNELVKVKK